MAKKPSMTKVKQWDRLLKQKREVAPPDVVIFAERAFQAAACSSLNQANCEISVTMKSSDWWAIAEVAEQLLAEE